MIQTHFWVRPIALWAMAVALAAGIFVLTAYSGYLAASRGQAEETLAVLQSMLRSLPIWGAAWAGFVALYLVGYRGGARLLPLFGKGWRGVLLSGVAFAGSIASLWMITQIPYRDPAHIPFIGYWLAFAIYFQALRAAAVARAQPQQGIERLFE